ncbi:MAG: hypothetical protein J2P31_04220 [Blastocatellia bacterium]|nr:hypothetical protein [Blastocatellia bacterium]
MGELAEQDRDPIEVRLLTDPQYISQLARVEDELTDQYVRCELSRHERELFENHFMNAQERRENVFFTKALDRYVSSEAIARPGASAPRAWKDFLTNWSPPWRVARNASLACAALLLIVAVTWPLVKAVRLQRRLAEVETEQSESRRLEQELKRQLDEQRSHSEDLVRQLESSRSRLGQMDREIAGLRKAAGSTQTEGGEIAMALFPGLGRDAADSAQERTVNLPPGAKRLRLELGVDYTGLSSYRAEARTADGNLVWSREALRERSTRIGKAVVITLPVSLLTKNAYLIVLSGAAAGRNYEKLGTYYFEIKSCASI